jgi:hypothetical protein
MPDSIEDIAQRLERVADRYHNAADFQAEHDARAAAERARRASSLLEAQQIEQQFIQSHIAPTIGGAAYPTQSQYVQLSRQQGCLSGWFGNLFNRNPATPWRSSSAGTGPRVAINGGPYFRSWSVYPRFSSSQYANYTLASAVSRHLPPGQTDPNAYAQQIADQTGLDPNTRLGDLSPHQLAALTSAIDADPSWAERAIVADLSDIAAGASTPSFNDEDRPGEAHGSPDSDFGDSPTPTDNS